MRWVRKDMVVVQVVLAETGGMRQEVRWLMHWSAA